MYNYLYFIIVPIIFYLIIILKIILKIISQNNIFSKYFLYFEKEFIAMNYIKSFILKIKIKFFIIKK